MSSFTFWNFKTSNGNFKDVFNNGLHNIWILPLDARGKGIKKDLAVDRSVKLLGS